MPAKATPRRASTRLRRTWWKSLEESDETRTRTRSVAENTAAGEPVGAPLAATDGDGDALTYALSGADADAFAIDENSGQLRTRAALDYETRTRYEITVTADDGRGGSASLPVAVVVTDVDEPPAAPATPVVTEATRSSLTVTWTAPENAGRPAVTGYDAQYRAEGDSRFTEVALEGTGTAAVLTGLVAGTAYEVQVRASNDEGTGPWSGSGSGRTRTNGNPVFDLPDPSSPVERRIAENTAAGEPVGAPLAATDDDGDALTYALSGADPDAFAIDENSGQLRTRAALDYETRARYEITVTADDGRGGSASLPVAVVVTDVDEPPAAPGTPVVTEATRSSLTVTWTAPENAGRPAVTGYDAQYRAEGDSRFTEVALEGTGTAAVLTGLVADTAYEVQVRASNDEGTGPWSGSGSGRTRTNSNPVFGEERPGEPGSSSGGPGGSNPYSVGPGGPDPYPGFSSSDSDPSSPVERRIAENTAAGEPVGARLQHEESQQGHAERERGRPEDRLKERPPPLSHPPMRPHERGVGQGHRRKYRQAAAPECERHADDEAQDSVIAEPPAFQHIQHPPERNERQQHDEGLGAVEVRHLDVEDRERPQRRSKQAGAAPEQAPPQEEQQHYGGGVHECRQRPSRWTPGPAAAPGP